MFFTKASLQLVQDVFSRTKIVLLTLDEAEVQYR